MEAENKKKFGLDDVKRFFAKLGTTVKNNIKIPGIGFGCLVVAFVLAIVSFAKYYALYDLAGYENNRWTVMFSWLGILCLAFLIVNALFKGDKPTWSLFIYAAAAFMLIFAMLQFLQPCVSEIAFVLGSPDLAMGDNAIRVAISDGAIATAVLYAVTCVFVIIAAFAPSNWTFGKKKGEPLFVVTCEPVSWETEDGITLDVTALEVACKDNGKWKLAAEYSQTGGKKSSVRINGKRWIFDGESVVLFVPENKKSLLGGAAEIRVKRTAGESSAQYTAEVCVNFAYAVTAEGKATTKSALREFTLNGEIETTVFAQLNGDALYEKTSTDEQGKQSETTARQFGKLVLQTDLTFKYLVGEDGENLVAVADGRWYNQKRDVVLDVVNDGNNAIAVDADGSGVKSVVVKGIAVRKKYEYAVKFKTTCEEGVVSKIKLVGESVVKSLEQTEENAGDTADKSAGDVQEGVAETAEAVGEAEHE